MHLLNSLPLFLAQAADDTGYSHPQQLSPAANMGVLFGELLIFVLVVAGLWKIFTKAGYPGWGAIIPFYNAYLLCKVAGKPGWWVILLIIPLVNFIISILVFVGLARNFGRGIGFTLGLIFLGPFFLPILGFGSSRYVGNTGAGTLNGGTAPYPTI